MVLSEMNHEQRKFLERMGRLQEKCVQSALCSCEEMDAESLLYDATGQLIADIMAVLDGYDDTVGQLSVRLKEEPFIELHDAVVEFIKFEKEKGNGIIGRNDK